VAQSGTKTEFSLVFKQHIDIQSWVLRFTKKLETRSES